MTRYTQLVTAAPRVDRKLAGIMRTNSDLTKQYDDLKNKLSQASLSESLESARRHSISSRRQAITPRTATHGAE